ncbi:hypothetical protein NKJ71_26150 [Mesorhizobium sp. M0050]|uniref:hypothetical protein n=1 Tax=Mesorhizobium sp. M0050 TaxID=2956861 RepID=UPI00333B2F0F
MSKLGFVAQASSRRARLDAGLSAPGIFRWHVVVERAPIRPAAEQAVFSGMLHRLFVSGRTATGGTWKFDYVIRRRRRFMPLGEKAWRRTRFGARSACVAADRRMIRANTIAALAAQ